MWNLKDYHALAIGMSVLAGGLLIAACAAPIWIWLDPDEDHVGVGLFNRVGFEPDGSTTFAVNDVKFIDEQTRDCRHWSAMAGLEVTATVMGCLLVPLLYSYTQRYKKGKNMIGSIKTILAVDFFAWVTNVVGLIIFALYHGDALTEGPDVSDDSFSWGALMAFIAATAHFWIFYIVYFKFLYAGDGHTIIPSAADPKMGLYPSTKNAVMNRFFLGAPYANGALPGEGNDVFAPEPRLAILPPDDFNDRRELMPLPATPADRYQPVVRELGNRYSTRIERPELPQRVEAVRPVDLRTATVLQARDLDEIDGDEEEIVFRKVSQPKRNRDLESAEYIVRKPGGDFIVPAKHNTDRDVYRTEKYLVHTSKPSEDVVDGQRLVLSPSNFTETNVKYNPSYMYRPYSERVY